jgi:hypothetical protein
MRLPAVHHGSRTFCLGLLIGLLVCSLTAFAQSQAPVDWSQSEVRWFGVGTQWIYYNQALALQGDTIFVADRRYEEGHGNPYLALFYSYNNGQSFDSMRLDTGYWNGPDVHLSVTSGRLFAFCNDHYPRGWIRHCDSDNLELTTSYVSSGPGLTAGYAVDAQVIAIQALTNIDTHLVIEAIGSEDTGTSWSTPQILNIGHMQVIDNCMGATQSHFLALGWQWESTDNASILYICRRVRINQTWTPFNRLPGQPYIFYSGFISIAADTGSETAIVLTAADIGAGGAPKQIRMHRTADGGDTWELPRLLTQDAPINGRWGSYPIIFCRGKLWGVAWEKSEGNSDELGLYWRLSANHGKDWYPAQRVLLNYFGMTSTVGQFYGNEARLYWRGSPAGAPDDYGTINGLMAPDTIVPIITQDALASDTVDVGDRILFSATASDNDTLSGVTLTVLDSTNIPFSLRLARQSQGRFWGNFTVPHAGFYRYRLTAEDFWENSTSDPDNGWVHFQTRGWSPVGPRGIVHPSSFSVSVSPNPFNSSTRISFTLPTASFVDLNVYDLTGRLVRRLAGGHMDPPLPAGEHEVVFDGSELPSGIYFLRMQAGEFSHTQKIILLK